jgi:hypothetical protein
MSKNDDHQTSGTEQLQKRGQRLSFQEQGERTGE